MKKVVIADDEEVIARGLQYLIDWNALGVEVVDTVYDGEQLQHAIESLRPDIVISDVMMPKQTGLSVIENVKPQYPDMAFIFISGYQEFSYAQTALKHGAIDYLLKPVREDELRKAVKKAIDSLNSISLVEAIPSGVNEVEELFWRVNDRNEQEGKALYELFADSNINFANRFMVGLCIGICPDVATEMGKQSFEKYNLIRFALFNQVSEYFVENKCGFVVRRDDYAVHIIGTFPKGEENSFYDVHLRSFVSKMEEAYGVRVAVGIGVLFDDWNQVKNSYKTAQYCFELYFFLEQSVIDFDTVNKVFEHSEKQYEDAVAEVFPAMVAHDEALGEKVQHVMDMIEEIHFGHQMAARTRVMIFTGDISSKLSKLNMIQNDFYKMQDQLQSDVAEATSFRQLREMMDQYFSDLMQEVERSHKSKDSLFIEEVKDYINMHYMEDLSIKKLAEVACVSQNYFSAMFKKETGENYKSYLTRVRMDAAIRLLQETDDKTYEISEKVGYNNVRRFVDAFKQVYSVSPTEYRKGSKRT